MTTFDADKARARREGQLNELTDDLMADLMDRFKNNGLDRPTKVALAGRLIEVLVSDSAAAAFANGDSAGTSAGGQLALSSGGASSVSNAFKTILTADSSLVPGKIKNAIKRLVMNDPDPLEVNADGVPVEIANLHKELAFTKNPNENGSIMNQLQDATTKLDALSGVDADATKKAAAWDAVQPALDPLFEHDPRVGGFRRVTVKDIDPKVFEKAQEAYRKAVEDTK